MIGIIVELIVSWFLLRFFDGNNLSVLGLKPTKSNGVNGLAGLFLAAICCTIYQVMATAFAGNSWVLNPKVTIPVLLTGLWWVIKSVLFEELLFRGALLYIAITKWGTRAACIASAVCFGIYHWFSYNAFGNPLQMMFLFLMTGIFGWVLAYGFAKTSSLYLPVGLHLGWNLFNIVVFSNGPLGQQVFIKANANQLQGLLSLFVFLFQALASPALAWVYIKWLVRRKALQ